MGNKKNIFFNPNIHELQLIGPCAINNPNLDFRNWHFITFKKIRSGDKRNIMYFCELGYF